MDPQTQMLAKMFATRMHLEGNLSGDLGVRRLSKDEARLARIEAEEKVLIIMMMIILLITMIIVYVIFFIVQGGYDPSHHSSSV